MTVASGYAWHSRSEASPFGSITFDLTSMTPLRGTDRSKLMALVCLLLCCGFLATTLISYFSSRGVVRTAIIDTELPLTSDNVYSEIQRDLVRPVLISSMMSRDTFLRDWIIGGEGDIRQMTRYLKEVMSHYGAFTAFFVSDASKTYYHADGVLKRVAPEEPRDAWYFRVRQMEEPYEINVDPDLANRDKLTIFINYRVLDYQGQYIGATGVGLTVDAVVAIIQDYQRRFGRTIYFANSDGDIVLAGRSKEGGEQRRNIRDIPGLRDLADTILASKGGSFEYESADIHHFVNVRYIPELKWQLFVVKDDKLAVSNVQRALYFNLLVCACVTLLVLTLLYISFNRYNKALEEMAATDSLTGLANRHALELLLEQGMREATRQNSPLTAILFDIDHFKALNDSLGHLAGDRVLRHLGQLLQANLRTSDIACRWGGEEFLIVLKDTPMAVALRIAETLRLRVAEMPSAPKEAIQISAGVVAWQVGESIPALLERADVQLYRAKAAGRNTVCSDTTATTS